MIILKNKDGIIVTKNVLDLNNLPITIYIKCTNGNTEKLTWDSLVHAGSLDEKLYMNDLRMKYVIILKKKMNKLCKNICTYEGVGTTENITAESDIDINLNIKHKSFGEVVYIYNKIYKFHNKYFTQDFTELFDINIYGAIYPDRCPLVRKEQSCYDIIAEMNSQRYWAFSRLVDKYDFNHKITSKVQEMIKEIPQKNTSKKK